MWTIQVLYQKGKEPEAWTDWSGRGAFDTIERASEVMLRQINVIKNFAFRLYCHDTGEQIPSDIFQP